MNWHTDLNLYSQGPTSNTRKINFLTRKSEALTNIQKIACQEQGFIQQQANKNSANDLNPCNEKLIKPKIKLRALPTKSKIKKTKLILDPTFLNKSNSLTQQADKEEIKPMLKKSVTLDSEKTASDQQKKPVIRFLQKLHK